ncbi:fibronectin type III domain-containing protein [Couchioplanes caeruleus]|uniref:fibronectin type III domain-containing protein n=1 Tax=Couchioplanes caeruleus TaxID=56438 RepID=UPI0011608AFB|nr:fibronectin type III domain-containing protein [Couchioplanes caeruleus]
MTLIPVGLGGCAVPEVLGGAGTEAAEPVAAEPSAGWIVVQEGARQEEPVPVKAAPTPTAVPTLAPPAPAESSSPEDAGEPMDPRCNGSLQPGKIAGLDVVAGATSATVRWFHASDKNVRTYRITSIPQRLVSGRQAPLKWQEVKPGDKCSPLSATITGLRPGTPYTFSVDVVRATSWQNGNLAATIARSAVVTTAT